MENWQDLSKQRFTGTCSEHQDNILREQIISRLDLSRHLEDCEIKDLIDEELLKESAVHVIPLEKREALRKQIYYSIRKLGILQELMDDASISEIMINGIHGIFVEQEGRIKKLPVCFETRDKLNHVIQQIVTGCNRVINEASPIVDARLPDGSRVNAVLPPVALNGPILTIRRFPENPITMEKLIQLQSLPVHAGEFLQRLVVAGYNIIVSGGTGSGKTTFLNVLSNFIPSTQRVITIEDSAELQIRNIPNLVTLETRNVNVEGCKEITIRDLIKTSLRMRPDRLIVGEVRGRETVDMLQSMNVGHYAMTTVHANSIRDVISRLETMVLMEMELPVSAIRKQIVSAFDLMIHLGRIRDGSRRVVEIAEPIDYADGEVIINTLYSFEEATGEKDGRVHGNLVKKGNLMHEDKLKAAGVYEN